MRSLAIVVLAACGGSKTEPTAGSSPPAPVVVIEDAPARSPTGEVTCEALPFAESSPVPEASGAAWLDRTSLLVISDSGNDGAYAIVDPESGVTREQGELPLGGKRDDLEGVAMRNNRVVGVTSPGFILEWERLANGFKLVAGPYALGPIDLPDRDGGFGVTPPEGDGMVCPERRTNCGRNYEGICLAPAPTGGCVGYVAAKADGHLYCLVERDGKLAVDRAGAIAVTQPGALADCAYSDDGALYAASNSFDSARVYRIEDGKAVVLAELAAGFPETLAVRGEVFYRMSDAGKAPSAMKKYRCRGR
jgi:hypothetical protein